jgi:ABC-type proline/glycine betaine transport system ATPase subunit
MSKNKELANDYFDRHPASTECHITSDGRVFHQLGTAQGYAASLKDDTVEKFTKDVKNIEVKDAKVVSELTEEEIAAAEQAAAEANNEALKAFNPETTPYADAKALVKALGLTSPSQKGEDINATLLEAQSKITE